MLLSDKDILKEIKAGNISIKPFRIKNLQPASYDLSMGNSFLIFNHTEHALIDVKKKVPKYTTKLTLKNGARFIIHPGEFALGTTLESVKLGGMIVGRIEGRSSLGRLGVVIHATAGFVDPGFEGCLTLEMSNFGKLPVALYTGMKIGQLAFHYISSKPLKLYKGKYSKAKSAMESKIYEDFK